MSAKKVLLLGESWVSAATHYKGFDQFSSVTFHTGADDFVAALKGGPFEVTWLVAHQAVTGLPFTAEALAAYDAIILSDIGSNSLLLHPDVWPHASRASFVTLLMEKGIATPGVALECAVGMRLAFRQPPPIDCVSSQFLLYLNSTIANTAYQTWSHLVPQAEGLFPPERFHFDVWSVGD